MGPIEEALREKFCPMLFRGEEVTADFQNILGHIIKFGGLGIPDPQLSAESAYNTSKAASGELVESLLGGSALNYIGHRAYIRKSSLVAIHEKIHVELGELARGKELEAGRRTREKRHP